MFVIVLEADYGGTYFETFGGVHGPYDSVATAEDALRAAGFSYRDRAWLHRRGGSWKNAESASIVELEPLPIAATLKTA